MRCRSGVRHPPDHRRASARACAGAPPLWLCSRLSASPIVHAVLTLRFSVTRIGGLPIPDCSCCHPDAALRQRDLLLHTPHSLIAPHLPTDPPNFAAQVADPILECAGKESSTRRRPGRPVRAERRGARRTSFPAALQKRPGRRFYFAHPRSRSEANGFHS